MTHATAAAPSLYTSTGERKYLNRTERTRALTAAQHLPLDRMLFCLTLAWTGARISEVLALTPAQFQVNESLVSILTLKRRRLHIREVPIPPFLMQALNGHYRLRDQQVDANLRDGRLWPFHRTTAWRIVKQVMTEAGLHGAISAPKAFRHGFGVGTVQAGVPITQLQRWLGHARLSTTAIYTEVAGPEELSLARRYWRWSSASNGPRDKADQKPTSVSQIEVGPH